MTISRDSSAVHNSHHPSPPAAHWTAAAGTKHTGPFLPVWRSSTPAALVWGGRVEHAPPTCPMGRTQRPSRQGPAVALAAGCRRPPQPKGGLAMSDDDSKDKIIEDLKAQNDRLMAQLEQRISTGYVDQSGQPVLSKAQIEALKPEEVTRLDKEDPTLIDRSLEAMNRAA